MRSEGGLCCRVMDNLAADAPDPGPHARFPWAPALLCAASLAMAGWTWMRYSYCSASTPRALTQRLVTLPPEGLQDMLLLSKTFAERQKAFTREWRGRYVLVRPDEDTRWLNEQPSLTVNGTPTRMVWMEDARPQSPATKTRTRRSEVPLVLLCSSENTGRTRPPQKAYAGRVVGCMPREVRSFTAYRRASDLAIIDTSASRFHPASVAGLVVAAFGTFVFGLYLRGWVKERGGRDTV